MDFPHMQDTAFPHIDTVDVYKYKNELDYGRYDYSQMDIMVCTVPWDMGEAHIGNRTIDGIGNVVYFGDTDTRDAWFDAIPDTECFRWATKFKELHRDETLDVPLPFDVAAKYNYVVVSYHLFANDGSPLQYETDKGLRKWFWFIREVEFVAPNTTRLHIMPDAWQTFIYDVEIPAMMLGRGHAPVFDTSVDAYLSNPRDNCKALLADDSSYGELSRVEHTDVVALNSGDMWACIATTADMGASDNGSEWGSKADDDWIVNTGKHWTQDGAPNVLICACEPSDFNTFLENMVDNYPQWFACVQGVFFVSKSLVNLRDDPFTFGGVQFTRIAATQKTLDFVKLDKTQFGYDAEYAGLAKLYTYPYAAIEITDEDGDVSQVRIEDTTGTVQVGIALNLIFPYLTATATMIGIGANGTSAVTFRNITGHTFRYGGRWYDYLKEWSIPAFSVELGNNKYNDYATHFDRLQMANARDTARSNAYASADTARDNSNRSAAAARTTAKNSADTARTTGNNSADTAKANANRAASSAQYSTKHNAAASATASKATANTERNNANRSAGVITDNANVQAAANTYIQQQNKAASNRDVSLSNAYGQAQQAWAAGLSRDLVNNDLDAKQQSTSLANSVGMAESVGNGIVSGAGSGNTPVGSVIGAVVGGITGAVNGGINAYVNQQQYGIMANAESTKVELTVSNSQSTLKETQQSNQDRTDNANSLAANIRSRQNTLTKTTASNSASVMKTNATSTYNTTRNNATRIQTAINESADNTYSNTTTSNAASNTTAHTNNDLVRTTARENADTMYEAATGNSAASRTTARENAGRDYDLASERIKNQIRQARLMPPRIFGQSANAETAASKPMALFANIVTQDKNSIARAGDEFLRYGYRYNRYYKFDGKWCRGRYFTYWQLNDFWVKNLNVPDMYMDRLRFFLFGGVTVWSRPEDIGNVSIYENGV